MCDGGVQRGDFGRKIDDFEEIGIEYEQGEIDNVNEGFERVFA